MGGSFTFYSIYFGIIYNIYKYIYLKIHFGDIYDIAVICYSVFILIFGNKMKGHDLRFLSTLTTH